MGIGPIGLKLGRRVTIIIGTWPKRYCGPAASTPWPDCSGKRVRAPKGLLPGEQPEQPKFVLDKASYFTMHNFICQEMTT